MGGTKSPAPNAKQRGVLMTAPGYTEEQKGLIELRATRFAGSLGLFLAFAFVALYLRWNPPETFLGVLILAIAQFGSIPVILWMCYAVFRLSRAIDPQPLLAWTMVALQFFPLLNLIAAASILRKAYGLCKPVKHFDEWGDEMTVQEKSPRTVSDPKG